MKYENRLKNIVLNLFEWEGLPDGIDQRVLENNLIQHGQVMFYESKKYGLLCLPASPEGDYNIYYQPLHYVINGFNYQDRVHRDDGVIIFNNLTAENTIQDIKYYAAKLEEIDATQDVNLLVQKTPYIVQGTRENITSLKTGVKQILNNSVVVAITKDFDVGGMNVLNLNPPYLLDKLQDHKNNIMGEFLTLIGIDNNVVDKKERAVVSEVEANEEFIEVSGDSMLVVRERAAKAINAKYGLNITVKRKMIQDEKEEYDDYDEF